MIDLIPSNFPPNLEILLIYYISLLWSRDVYVATTMGE